jgi:hypothetical protein
VAHPVATYYGTAVKPLVDMRKRNNKCGGVVLFLPTYRPTYLFLNEAIVTWFSVPAVS